MRPEKKKLVILGGGIGSLVTAWHLTSQPNWKEIYESITVYQTGWRLGGKCASGRGPNGRIEEHRLHIWFGFYDNSFAIGRQATVKSGNYDPLVRVKDLECWPSAPNLDQLVEGEEIRNLGANLESFYTTWNDVETLTLRAGEHFDDVVFGISLASIPYLCGELLRCDENWRAMVDKVETTRTMAFQAWMNKDLKELGWDRKAVGTTASTTPGPLSPWAALALVP